MDNITKKYLLEELHRCQKNIGEIRTKMCNTRNGDMLIKLTMSLNYWLKYEEQLFLELRGVNDGIK